MGHIKEPEGIDFVIQSEPLTNEIRKEISNFIKDYKDKKKVRKMNSGRLLKEAKLFMYNHIF